MYEISKFEVDLNSVELHLSIEHVVCVVYTTKLHVTNCHE